jgi:hypothetical protein
MADYEITPASVRLYARAIEIEVEGSELPGLVSGEPAKSDSHSIKIR